MVKKKRGFLDMLLSIIIPVYNASKYLEKCLYSIVNQTLNDFEIIVINDGSTDGSKSICQRFEKKFDNILYIETENNGPSHARNLGLKYAKGKYIGFVDADDYIDKTMYEKMLQYAEYFQADITICKYVRVWENGEKMISNNYFSDNVLSGSQIKDKILKSYYTNNTELLASPCNKIYLREFILNSKVNFNQDLIRGEDWWFNLLLYEKASRISYIDIPLYMYRQDNMTSIMKKMSINYYEEWKTAREYLNKQNEVYKFKIDYNAYYQELLMNIHSLLINIVKQKKDIDDIIYDDFYNMVIVYDKNCSMPVKIAHFINKYPKLLKIYYKILSKMY